MNFLWPSIDSKTDAEAACTFVGTGTLVLAAVIFLLYLLKQVAGLSLADQLMRLPLYDQAQAYVSYDVLSIELLIGAGVMALYGVFILLHSRVMAFLYFMEALFTLGSMLFIFKQYTLARLILWLLATFFGLHAIRATDAVHKFEKQEKRQRQ